MRLDPKYSATAPKVLVIDDDKGLREIIWMTLVPNCEVKTAASVDEGLRIFEALNPDIVIIDFRMPVKNGIQGIREIREIDPEVPVILLTGFADMGMAREAMDLGVTEYMTKPFNVTDLKHTVDNFTRTRTSSNSETPSGPNTPSEPSRFSTSELPEFDKLEPLSRFSPTPTPSPHDSRSVIDPAGPALGRLILKENYMECVGSNGVVFRSNILRLNPKSIVCEIFNPKLEIQAGDVLTDCTIQLGKPTFFIEKATVKEIINTSILLICEISLDREWYQHPPRREEAAPNEKNPSTAFASGVSTTPTEEAGPESKIEPMFKRVVSQLGILLRDMQDTMKQFESRLHTTDTAKRQRMEQSLMRALSAKVVPAMNRLSERFEEVAATMPVGREELHRLYVRHHLNRYLPFVLDVPPGCGRPIGCPGDYRIPDRIFEPAPPESSLFDKTIRSWLMSSPPGEAVGYRTRFLAETLRSETMRCREAGRSPKIFSIARGSIQELEEFLGETDEESPARFTLLGFSREAVMETRDAVNRMRRPSIQAEFVGKSVNQFLSEGNRLIKGASCQSEGKGMQREQYDMIYSSSLFHHFSDRVCQRFMEIFYGMLAPGGLIIVCDLTPRNPLRHLMNFVLDENLIHRTRQEMLALVPRNLPSDYYRITEVPNGVEVFLHVLKPESVPIRDC